MKKILQSQIISKIIVEAIASAMFHFLGSTSGTVYSNGITLMVLVYYTAKTSGAHLNPALSLTFFLLGYSNPIELICYWIAQLSGSMIGSLWLALLVPNNNVRHGTIGCFTPSDQISNIGLFGWEAICTFTFIVPIFSVVWYTNHKKGYGNTGPILVGLSLISSALAAANYTGGALNPARVLGSIAVLGCDEKARSSAVFYVTGEIVGAIIAPVAIIPWFGICQNSWYREYIPKVLSNMYIKSLKHFLLPDIESESTSTSIE